MRTALHTLSFALASCAVAATGAAAQTWTYEGCTVFGSCHTATLTALGPAAGSSTVFLYAFEASSTLPVHPTPGWHYVVWGWVPRPFAASGFSQGQNTGVGRSITGPGTILSSWEFEGTATASAPFFTLTLRETATTGNVPVNAPRHDIDLPLRATTAVPEPVSLALVGVGLLGLGGVAIRRRRNSADDPFTP